MLNQLLFYYPITTTLFFALFSLAVGSFLNVVIHRLPIMMKDGWTEQCHEFLDLPIKPSKKVNLFFPRSFCPACRTGIAAWHNFPLLSYCLLRGRSSCCKERISIRYPAVELLTLLLSLLAARHLGPGFPLVFALLFIWILIVICFIDLQHQIIPDNLSLGLLWLGLIANTQSLFTTLPNAVLSAVTAYLCLWLFIQLFYLMTGKIGMGNGDFKLFAAFGAWFGWTLLPFILLISSIFGALVGIVYLKIAGQSRETPIPFGPFLCLAGLIALFSGHDIIQWYIQLYI